MLDISDGGGVFQDNSIFMFNFRYSSNDGVYFCINGRWAIEWSLVCDGHKDCSDGSDEIKELCARYEYGTNINMDCGKNVAKKTINETPWLVYIERMESNHPVLGIGSIISPNVVVAMADHVWRQDLKYKANSIHDGSKYWYNIEVASKPEFNNPYYINAKMIYFVEDYNTKIASNADDLAVIVLADDISFSNGVSPVCIDWYNKYSVPETAQVQIFSTKRMENQRLRTRVNNLDGHHLHIDDSSCLNLYDTYNIENSVTYDKSCIRIIREKNKGEGFIYQSLNILYLNSYFLTGLKGFWSTLNNNSALGFIDIKYYLAWIRGVLNKHGRDNSCVIPTVKGVVYSYADSREILSPGTSIKPNVTVVENCIVGYHKTLRNSFRVCQSNGKWKTISEKLCLKMCPPLISDSLDIKCTLNGEYANCSNPSIPDTKASPSCKPTYSPPKGQDTPLELFCQSNGKWNSKLYICEPANLCVLPAVEGVLYTYEDSDEILPHGTLINHTVTVIENCEVGYHKAYPNGFRVCQSNGKWKAVSEKLCIKMCPPLISDSLDIKCTLNGKYANCSNPSIPDTIASLSCKLTYTLSNGQEETPIDIHCQSNGIWNNQLYKCAPANLCVLPAVEGVLYTYEDSDEILPHGTLINHTVTVSENCEVGYHKAYPNGFRVCQSNGKWKAVSEKLCIKMCPPLISDSLDIKCTLNGKYANCSNPSIPDTIASPSCKLTYTLPNGQKETPIDIHCQSNGIWNNQLYRCAPANLCVLPTVEGVVYTYEDSDEILPHGTLVNHTVTVIENCEVEYHKAYPNGFRVCQSNGKWKAVSEKLCIKMCPRLISDSLDIKCTLNGKYANCSNPSIPDTIASLSCKPTYSAPKGRDTPLELFCQSNGKWNSQLYTCKPANLCILPTVEGVVYTYEDSNESLPHGTLIDHYIIVIENCEVGYHKAYTNGFRICQRNGKWKTVSEKLCLKMCPPLISDSLDIKCTLNGKYANCSNPSIPDTIASPSCKPTHTLPNGLLETPLEIHCQSNGIWNNQLYRCEPFCGKIYIKSQQLINNGENATIGTAPWNVGIYQFNKNNSIYDFQCGGSIIAPNLVISAAHCFWLSGMTSNTILVNDGRYKIAVGKYSRDFTIIDNQFTKIMNVETVYLKEGYNGVIGHHAEDISIILLENRISFSDGVAPVCIDWNGKFNVHNGDQGKIVGWGLTEKNILSPILLEASLPYVNNSLCRNMFRNRFESYVTVDKFCAGTATVSGQRVDSGDSGAGLCFLHSNLYHLTGVVSSKDPDTNNSIATFTDIRYHIQWIRRLYITHN